jgi:hypothetical protein
VGDVRPVQPGIVTEPVRFDDMARDVVLILEGLANGQRMKIVLEGKGRNVLPSQMRSQEGPRVVTQRVR